MRSLWCKVKIIRFAKWKEIIFLGFHSISILNLFPNVAKLFQQSYLKLGYCFKTLTASIKVRLSLLKLNFNFNIWKFDKKFTKYL